MEIIFAKNGPSLSDPPLSSWQRKGSPGHNPTPTSIAAKGHQGFRCSESVCT